jgi:enoyl-CoA hydratase/carnithine racemase
MTMDTRASNSLVTFSVENGIGLLTLNDPATQNSMSLSMMDALAQIHPVICADPEVRVLIVTGAGEAFSAGGNMHDMLDRQGVFADDDPIAARDINQAPPSMAMPSEAVAMSR